MVVIAYGGYWLWRLLVMAVITIGYGGYYSLWEYWLWRLLVMVGIDLEIIGYSGY